MGAIVTDVGSADARADGPPAARAPAPRHLSRSRAEVEQAPEKAEENARAFRAAIRAGEPACRIRELIDLHHHWRMVPSMVDNWVGLSVEELQRRIMPVEIEAVRLNDLVLAGLPGESLTETCQWLRAQSLGEKLIVFDMINGYGLYQTTREQYDLGGYSYWASCLSRDAERVTRTEALALVCQAAQSG